MGFSLKHFFEQLNTILSDESLPDEDKVRILQELVPEQYEYAKICNQLN